MLIPGQLVIFLSSGQLVTGLPQSSNPNNQVLTMSKLNEKNQNMRNLNQINSEYEDERVLNSYTVYNPTQRDSKTVENRNIYMSRAITTPPPEGQTEPESTTRVEGQTTVTESTTSVENQTTVTESTTTVTSSSTQTTTLVETEVVTTFTDMVSTTGASLTPNESYLLFVDATKILSVASLKKEINRIHREIVKACRRRYPGLAVVDQAYELYDSRMPELIDAERNAREMLQPHMDRVNAENNEQIFADEDVIAANPRASTPEDIHESFERSLQKTLSDK